MFETVAHFESPQMWVCPSCHLAHCNWRTLPSSQTTPPCTCVKMEPSPNLQWFCYVPFKTWCVLAKFGNSRPRKRQMVGLRFSTEMAECRVRRLFWVIFCHSPNLTKMQTSHICLSGLFASFICQKQYIFRYTHIYIFYIHKISPNISNPLKHVFDILVLLFNVKSLINTLWQSWVDEVWRFKQLTTNLMLSVLNIANWTCYKSMICLIVINI